MVFVVMGMVLVVMPTQPGKQAGEEAVGQHPSDCPNSGFPANSRRHLLNRKFNIAAVWADNTNFNFPRPDLSAESSTEAGSPLTTVCITPSPGCGSVCVCGGGPVWEIGWAVDQGAGLLGC